ncbi:hypothetical protein [Scytonema sp. NUACC21]
MPTLQQFVILVAHYAARWLLVGSAHPTKIVNFREKRGKALS